MLVAVTSDILNVIHFLDSIFITSKEIIILFKKFFEECSAHYLLISWTFVSDSGETQANTAMVCSGCAINGLSPFPLLYMDRPNNCFELLTNTISSLQHSERLMCWSVFFLTYAVSHGSYDTK